MAKLSEKDKQDIIEQLKQDLTYTRIAETFGVSRERIRQIARTVGLQGTGHQNRKTKRFLELDKKLKEKYGNFYKDGKVDKNDFLEVCLYKFSQKKARSYQHDWTIKFGDIEWNLSCPILGLELDYFAERRKENSPSFDRIDPSKGYIPGNVQIISWRANRIKNDGTSEEHYKIAEYLKEHGY